MFFEKLGFRNGWRDLVLGIGLAVGALSGSQVYAFGASLSAQMTSLGVNDSEMAVVKGLAVVGLLLTIFAGLVLDRYGPQVTLLCGAIANIVSWIALSFLPDATANVWVGLLLLLVLASFGEGFAFLALLKTSMQMHPSGGGVAMGLVSATMSLSLAVALASTGIASSCSGADCWRWYCRIFAVESAVFLLVGFFVLFLFRVENYPWLLQQSSPGTQKIVVNEADSEIEPMLKSVEEDASKVPMTLTGPDTKSSFGRSFRLFLHPAFLALFFAYFATMGSSLTVISSGRPIWMLYTNTSVLLPYQDSFDLVAESFSYANACSNVVTGILAGAISSRVSARSYYIFVMWCMAVCNVVLAVLLTVTTRSFSLLVLFGACLATLGVGFGAFLVLAAMSFGMTYGFTNFGVFYSWMQVAGSLGSILNPIFAQMLFDRSGTYISFAWMWCGALVVGALLMMFIPITEYKR